MEKIPITRHQVVSYFLPGFIFVLLSLIASENIKGLQGFIDTTKNITIFSAITVIVISFAIGIIFDGIRDGIVESLWDYFKPINWKYFDKASKGEIERLYLNFYTYYTFDINLLLSLIFTMIVFIYFSYYNYFLWASIIISTISSFFDSCSLRKLIREITNEKYR